MSQPALHPPSRAGAPARPHAYCPIPQRLIADLHDSPVAIGVYALAARLFLVAKQPVPLSRADVLRYDPTLKTGAVKRALDRLVERGWLIVASTPGHRKQRYTPAWGRVRGAPLPWRLDQPCLGRPRHVIRLMLDRALLDVCMGKLTPHETQAATITRYLTTPALSLADVGCYALTLAGLPRSTPALTQLGCVRDDHALPLPDAPRLLALLSQLPLIAEAGARDTALTLSGTRRLGLIPAAPSAERAQPLFFVPPGLIGSLIGPLIGSVIGAGAQVDPPATAAASPEPATATATPGITWEFRESSEAASPPPTPVRTNDVTVGGGVAEPRDHNEPRARRRGDQHRRTDRVVPVTPATQLLQTINVLPEQQIELADLSPTTVQTAIDDGKARPGIRDLAGWVVTLLRTHRDHGWPIQPPAPRAELPEDLRLAFARYAAAQENERRAGLPPDQPWFPPPDPAPLDGLGAPVRLWNQVQAVLQTQLSRTEFNSWIRRVTLQSLDRGVATIMAPNALVKEAIETRYLGALRDLLTMHVGQAVVVRVVLNPSAPAPAPAPSTATDDVSVAEAECRPAWITAARWAALPTMLRVTLAGSELVDGQVHGRDPFCRQLLAGRYAQDVGALLAAAVASG